jgi:hypothetical protein
VGNCNSKKTGLWFSPVQSYVYFQSCRLDLRTLENEDSDNNDIDNTNIDTNSNSNNTNTHSHDNNSDGNNNDSSNNNSSSSSDSSNNSDVEDEDKDEDNMDQQERSPKKAIHVVMKMRNASEIVIVIVTQLAREMRSSTTFLVKLIAWTLTKVGT